MDRMQPRAFAFALHEASGTRSRATAIIPAGTGALVAGTVLGEVTATPGHFVPSPDAVTAGIEGAEVAKAVLGYGVDAQAEDVEVAIVDRDIEVKIGMLVYDPSVDDQAKTDAKIAQLDAVGIRAR